MKHENPQTKMLEHSQAKVDLYCKYLSTYLNILSRVSFVNRIFIFDLLCGEGIYEDGDKGSPIIALDAIKNHFYANRKTCPNITVWFNDNGISQIDPDVYKIDRVKKYCEDAFIPPSVEVKFFREDFDLLLPEARKILNSTHKSKGIFFIDPYGYKEIKLAEIYNLLECGNTEVLLFLPIAQMYRFAEKSFNEPFPGSTPLRNFLTELFGTNLPEFNSVYEFISQMKESFRIYMKQQKVFVDTFTIERDSSNVYCLFFFTGHIRGYEKMLGEKWRVDPKRGKGYTQGKTLSFFSEVELSGYPVKLQNFILESEHRTNDELFRFGLKHGFLPKHTNEILSKWKKEGMLCLFSLDSKPARGFYIRYNSDRTIGVKIIE